MKSLAVERNRTLVKAILHITQGELNFAYPSAIPETRNDPRINRILHHNEVELGAGAEIVIVRHHHGKCFILVQTRSMKANATDGEVECRGTLLATILQGAASGFEDDAYRDLPVYAMGQRFYRVDGRHRVRVNYGLLATVPLKTFLGSYSKEVVRLLWQQGYFALLTAVAGWIAYRLYLRGMAVSAELMALLETLPVGVVKLDISKRVFTYANKVADQIFQRKLVGEPDRVIVPDSYWHEHNQGIRNLVRGGEASALNKTSRDLLYGLLPDGSQIPLGINIAQLDTSEGIVVVGTIVDLTEITEEKEKNEQLMQMFLQHQKSITTIKSKSA